MIIPPELKKIITKRYNSHKNRCEGLGKIPPTKEIITEVLVESWKKGFLCDYCKTQMLIKDYPPFRHVPSIDHIKPISMGGNSLKDNLTVCCFGCNIIKGTLNGNTYIELLGKIGVGSELYKQIFKESFNGKLANKIQRKKEEQ